MGANMGFTKLDNKILDSSLWDEHSDVLKVFETFWTKSDPSGIVNATIHAIYRSANLVDREKKPLPFEDFEYALQRLLDDDPNSRTKDSEYNGRRIVRIDESKWLIVNYKGYRDYSYSDNPDSVRKRAYRQKSGTCPKCPESVLGHSASVSASVSESESFSESSSESESHMSDNKLIIRDHRECSELLKSRIQEHRQQKITDKTLEEWDRDVRLMIERDGRNIDQIKELVNECHDMPPSPSGFTWRDNILSMSKLRQRWNEGKIYLGMTKPSKNFDYRKSKQSREYEQDDAPIPTIGVS